MADLQTEEVDDWVVVKKQRIVILVPPPSPAQDKISIPRSKEQRNNPQMKNANSSPNEPPPHHHRRRPAAAPIVVNQRMKAVNLERRLERLGGLKRYLESLRLSRFVRLIEKEQLDKFQLVGLTMGKLKEMGADAVGPGGSYCTPSNASASTPICR
ncbi:unnamed protein product [Spirodela intermedia]|uniref:Uncharacterized protein n=1 Tax=Spirodela intermedia TaxID=51605 RepID=A0A7I8JSF5_SPIIN|nr:unnamed protein product [Spirodela intermedia]CAA6673137.1 unnamed protein product [Spirodela intermedia]